MYPNLYLFPWMYERATTRLTGSHVPGCTVGGAEVQHVGGEAGGGLKHGENAEPKPTLLFMLAVLLSKQL